MFFGPCSSEADANLKRIARMDSPKIGASLVGILVIDFDCDGPVLKCDDFPNNSSLIASFRMGPRSPANWVVAIEEQHTEMKWGPRFVHRHLYKAHFSHSNVERLT